MYLFKIVLLELTLIIDCQSESSRNLLGTAILPEICSFFLKVETNTANKFPNFEKVANEYDAKPPPNPGMQRKHESYMVLVQYEEKAKGKLYWPRVSALKPW